MPSALSVQEYFPRVWVRYNNYYLFRPLYIEDGCATQDSETRSLIWRYMDTKACRKFEKATVCSWEIYLIIFCSCDSVQRQSKKLDWSSLQFLREHAIIVSVTRDNILCRSGNLVRYLWDPHWIDRTELAVLLWTLTHELSLFNAPLCFYSLVRIKIELKG